MLPPEPLSSPPPGPRPRVASLLQPLTREDDDALRGLLGVAAALSAAVWLTQTLIELLP